MSHLSVRIDSPCTQSWQAMTPAGQGRFCDNCQKTVLDFSGLTDGELARLLAKQTGPACGRFQQSQLDRVIPVPTPGSYSPGRWFIVVVAGLLGWQTVWAETPPIRVALPSATQPSCTDMLLLPADTDATPSTDSLRVLTGRVVDQAGVVVAGAVVAIKETAERISTDADGRFQRTVPTERTDNLVTVTVSWIGYITQEISVVPSQQSQLSITLQEDTARLGEVTVVGNYRKPTFLERLRNRLPLKH